MQDCMVLNSTATMQLRTKLRAFVQMPLGNPL